MPDGIDNIIKCMAGICVFVTVITGPLAGLVTYSGFHVLGTVNDMVIILLGELYFLGIVIVPLGGLVIGVINMIIFYQFVLLMVGLQCIKNFLGSCRLVPIVRNKESQNFCTPHFSKTNHSTL